jgi:hypothetical protein
VPSTASRSAAARPAASRLTTARPAASQSAEPAPVPPATAVRPGELAGRARLLRRRPPGAVRPRRRAGRRATVQPARTGPKPGGRPGRTGPPRRRGSAGRATRTRRTGNGCGRSTATDRRGDRDQLGQAPFPESCRSLDRPGPAGVPSFPDPTAEACGLTGAGERARLRRPGPGQGDPYGIYNATANTGWVNVGTDAGTGAFAVESLRRWWNCVGRQGYPDAAPLLITADSGGSNVSRLRLWTTELAALAAETGLETTVVHLPARRSGTGSSTACSATSR